MIAGRLMKRVACVLLLASCGDDPNTGASAGSSGGSTGAASTSTAPVPTTGASDDASGTAGETLGTNSSLPTTGSAADTSTGAAQTTTAVDPDTTAPNSTSDASTTAPGDTSDSQGSSSTNGETGGCADPDECPAPPDACAVATCEASQCGVGPAPIGTPCQTGVCDDDGTCVECNLDADCPGQVCVANVCTPPPANCMDSLKNGGESDVDCGGPCPACPDGKTCQQDGDCLSDDCTGGTCKPAPTCSDGLKNGMETDTDCGGPDCSDCADGETCNVNADCLSNLCTNNVCTAQPTCMDSLKNGTETDVDCGGPDCPDCANGETCTVNADCLSGLCSAGVCKAQPNCMDNQKNGAETDVDCGGGTCPDCPDGDACLVDGDCLSNVCVANTCGQPLPQCVNQPADPATGQRCPLFMSCTQSSECGVFQGCQQWFCNNAKKCELNALVDCWQNVGGACNSDVVFTQQTLPPVAKRFVPPDGVDFRELASLVFTVKNNTVNDLYLDKLPLALDVNGGGSKFDVSSVKIFDNSGGSEHGLGDILVCLTADPFSFPANGVMGPCAGSAFARVPKNGGTQQFVVNVAFAANKTFINGRGYRLRLASTAGIQFKVGFNGPLFAGTMCGVPGEGYTGAWVTAQTP